MSLQAQEAIIEDYTGWQICQYLYGHPQWHVGLSSILKHAALAPKVFSDSCLPREMRLLICQIVFYCGVVVFFAAGNRSPGSERQNLRAVNNQVY